MIQNKTIKTMNLLCKENKNSTQRKLKNFVINTQKNYKNLKNN